MPEGGEGEQADVAVDAAALEAARRGGGLHRCRDVDTAYHKLNKIDEGTYGVVYRARCRLSERIVALKQVKLERAKEGFPLTALRELTVLLELRHANIVDVFEVVVSPKKQVFMVMEYMDHDFRSLMESMTRPFRTSEVKCLMQQLLSGVEYMHRHWVIHRDLKTSNLLLDNRGVLKVCDFGLARLYREPIKSMTPEVVTLWYRAPELLFGEKTYTTAIDQWSVGCIMAELVLKEPILRGRNEQEQRDKIVEMMGTPSEDNWPGFSLLPGAKGLRYKKRSCCLRDKLPKVSYTGGPSLSDVGFDLLLRMLDYDPVRRLGAGEALKHGWFSEAPLAVKTEDMPTFPSMHEVPKNQRKLKRGLEEDGPSQAFFNDDIRFNREMKA
uniref:Protein kinase domain-containing protein n=1 Tax=Cryptomonas curvata TaxID=233186 RepID=A0A7S0QIZ2_9CRYP